MVKSIITTTHPTTTVLMGASLTHTSLPQYVSYLFTSIQFPLFLLFITFFSLLSTAFLYENHTKLVNGSNFSLP